MPDANKYNVGYRPTTYFGTPEGNFSRIKGELRRQHLKENPEESSKLFDESLPDIALSLMGNQNTSLLGGEYLPDFREDEVEIARITLENNSLDVISIRAGQKQANIIYRIVDEYETVYKFNIPQNDIPLTLSEIIVLIDSIRADGEPEKQITNPFRDYNLFDLPDPESEIDFVKVTSFFYQELESWYHEDAAEYLEMLKLNKGKPS